MLPPRPEGAALASAPCPLRYEDITQDGRLQVTTAAQAVNPIWASLWRSPLVAAFKRGEIPILARLALETEPGPFAVSDTEGTARGVYQLAHTRGANGEVERILLGMWAEMECTVGRAYGPRPPNAGERAIGGRVYAEHVFTRLFAPKGERRVTKLDAPGIAEVPEPRVDTFLPETLLELPAGAHPLEEDLREDPVPLALGLCHTDSNQHVNSLVYPRLFEEAALRRLAELGKKTAVLTRRADVAFRKPLFAGQVARVQLRAFELGDRVGIVGAITSADDPTVHAYGRLELG